MQNGLKENNANGIMAKKVYMQTFTLKENVVVRCERKVQRVHQKNLTLQEQNKQPRKKIMTKLCPRGKAAAKKKI